jgi:hypothetical protein
VAYWELLQGADVKMRKRLLGGGVTAVALVTLRHQEALARNFWGPIADNDGLRRGDPRATLHADLLGSSRTGDHGALATIFACTAAWNAYFQRRNLTSIRPSKHGVRLMGTPFTVTL